MTAEILLLAASAATIAFVHTLLGPDHYLPLVAMARSRGWSVGKTMRISLLCGCGHVAGSIILGAVGIIIGVHLGTLEWIESIRGELAAWALTAFGLVYMTWGLHSAQRKKPHDHWHSHGNFRHRHPHNHYQEHAHVHDQVETGKAEKKSIAPWVIFIIFVLGPCEPLIPLLMFPAANENILGVFLVTLVFAVVTLLTMLVAIFFSVHGLRHIKLSRLETYKHAITGGTVMLCGLSISVLGL
ncbi:MAG: sulfite exporter TauE/SafE family protein [Cellvibrionales bacterium]|nr:sulfite exporter TauE/SafE family protein [Cellvibrionales bacterium]